MSRRNQDPSQNHEPQVYPSLEDQRAAEKRPHRHRNTVLGLAAAAGIGAGIVAPHLIGGAAPDKQASTANLEAHAVTVEQAAHGKEAALVAQRFNCAVVSATDMHAAPTMEDAKKYGVFDGLKDRTTVELTIAFTPNHAADQVLEQYKDDDTVAWMDTHVVGGLTTSEHPDMQPAPVAGDTSVGFHPATETVKMFPRNTYSDGSRITVAASNTVMTFDADNLYTTTGETPCGVLEMYQGEWKFNPDEHPAAPSVTVEADPHDK